MGNGDIKIILSGEGNSGDIRGFSNNRGGVDIRGNGVQVHIVIGNSDLIDYLKEGKSIITITIYKLSQKKKKFDQKKKKKKSGRIVVHIVKKRVCVNKKRVCVIKRVCVVQIKAIRYLKD